jgi:hypothetical protein
MISSGKLITHNYQPLPFQHRDLDTNNYDYQQVVNYVEIQSADGYITLPFRTIDAFASFLQRKELKGAYLIAHYGQGFDFQLLYQHMFRADGLMHGKMKNPIMRGNKIIKGFIFNDITLVDSYSYISSGLAEFPKMFGLQELRKGFFPHLLNVKPFWDYVGPIPDKEWYAYREMKPSKQKEFLEWHAQKVQEQYVFDFEYEMKAYCHSDVDILTSWFPRVSSIVYDHV